MAKVKITGMDKYLSNLERLSVSMEREVLGPALYDGAGIMADAMRQALRAVPTDETHDKDTKTQGPTEEALNAVIDALGTTHMQRDNGKLNIKVGFQKDYDDRPTKGYPKGRPILMLARSIRSGTSWMLGHDFVKQAKDQYARKARTAMKNRVVQEINKIMK